MLQQCIYLTDHGIGSLCESVAMHLDFNFNFYCIRAVSALVENGNGENAV